LLIHILTFIEL